MKKMIMTLLMLCCIGVSASAQDIYNEVKRMQKNFETVKYDKTKKLDERKVASFQWDAIEYMLFKANDDSTFTERQLGEQTLALTEFVKLYFKRLSEKSKDKDKNIVVARFRNASLSNSLFNDLDKDLVLAYVNSSKFPTPFSLDTNWVKALAQIRSMSWD
jgi:hypothetical protein